ncbi:amino acid ABC transporter permease [Pollutimonas bauzanensis]|uniref:Polar amino acid transport system permease protein n=1 Tax=Pollutimonas bauzanensis TaxID=658167 RepID=A0A1M5VEL6_9BURK|nr:amino acid ABC transporter permease [Pollutimonas bauzanensis]SHH73554.1 polar amino acid transport system permease protein [Pollutimonas bauzanensis]
MPALSETLLQPKYLGWLFDGWMMTLWAAFLVVALSTVLGFLLAAMRSSTAGPWRSAGSLYVSIFRNIPLLVQLFFWYFGAPRLLPAELRTWIFNNAEISIGWLSIPWPSFEFLSAITGMVFYSTAYVGEEIRAGIQGVPKGQYAAAAALGFAPAGAMRWVVLPQALRLALPSLVGQYMNILKNTSLAMAIGMTELSYAARQVEAETFRTFQAFGVATLLYVLSIAVLEVAGKRLHRRYMLAYGQR